MLTATEAKALTLAAGLGRPSQELLNTATTIENEANHGRSSIHVDELSTDDEMYLTRYGFIVRRGHRVEISWT